MRRIITLTLCRERNAIIISCSLLEVFFLGEDVSTSNGTDNFGYYCYASHSVLSASPKKLNTLKKRPFEWWYTLLHPILSEQ